MALDSAILRVLMDTIPDRIYFKDLQSRFVRNNLAHARELGVATPEDCIGKTDFDYFSREHAERAYADEQAIIRTGQPIINKTELITTRDGSQAWGSTTKLPWYDQNGRLIGTFGLTRDVTPAKRAEERLIEERTLLRTIIDNLPSRLYVKDQESKYVLNNRAHLNFLGVKDQTEAVGRTTTDFFPGKRGEQALADDKLVLAGERIINQEKPDFAIGGNHWSLVTKVPLHDLRGKLIGLVGISHDITRRKIAEQELERRTEEMEADLRMARQVQEAFLTRPYPVFPGATGQRSALEFAHRYIPATTLGGDFFDFVRISDTLCGVVVCDVMGHGVRAGLLTSLVRGVVEEMGFRAADPAAVLGEINRSLMPVVEQTGQPVFATVFLGIIDLTAGTLLYANAGHPAPMIVRGDTGVLMRLAPNDPEPAAGLIADIAFTNHQCAFGTGDLLLGFTDGVIEAANAAGEMFGDQRLWEFLRRTGRTTPEPLCVSLLDELQRFSERTAFEDDVCVVAVQAARPN